MVIRPARCLWSLAAAALYVFLSVLASWPLLPRAATHLPRGSEPVATVPFVSAWALWWTSDRAAHGFEHYWQAPIFYPAPDTFALSEPMPLAGLLVAPLLGLGLPLALAYNLFVLGASSLNGLATYWLLRGLRLTASAAIGGGALVCLLPVVHHQLGVPALVPLFGLVFALHAAVLLLRAPSLRRGLALGVALAASYLLCAQYALLLSLVLCPALLMAAGSRALRPRFLLAGIVAAGALMILIAPIVWAQLRVRQQESFTHSARQIERGGALLRSYIRSPQDPLVAWPGLRIDHNSGTALYPGSLRVLLGLGVLGYAAAECVRARRARRPRRAESSHARGETRARASPMGPARRRIIAFLAALIALAFLVSVSPHLHAFGWSLRDGLARIVPGFAQIRSVWRAGVIVQLGLALLAAHGLHCLQLKAAGLARWRGRRAAWLVAAIGALASCEVWPTAQALSAVPDANAYAGWGEFMQRELEPGEPYCVLPWVESGSVRAFEDIGRFMLLTAMHGRPMLNGYSSYFPAVHERLAQRKPHFGDRATAQLLRGYGVRYAVVRSSAVDARNAGAWRRVFAAPAADVSIYRLPEVTARSVR